MILGLAQWVRDWGIVVSFGVGRRHSSDPTLLRLWCRPAAVDPIQPLAWELPYAAGTALEKTKRQYPPPKNKRIKKKKKDN